VCVARVLIFGPHHRQKVGPEAKQVGKPRDKVTQKRAFRRNIGGSL
jgi:hypothetical protein